MYEGEKIAERIKKLAKEKNIQIKELLEKCNLNKNMLSSMYKGTIPKADNIAKIADELKVSIDYIMGRTTIKEINMGNQETKQN